MRVLIILCLLNFSFSSWGQSMKDLTLKDKIEYFFAHLSKDKMELVDEFYHPQVHFIDPVGTLDGAAKIKTYYSNMYKNVTSLRFDFSDFILSGDTVVAIWKMTLVTEKLNSGEPIIVDGNSVIRFDDKGLAIYHRDYFDMGAFIYENVPVVGFVVKKIKEKMKAE
jgi:hypothetical protein